jgi:hypothetical protein
MRKYAINNEGKKSIYPAWIRVGRYFDGAGLLVKSGLIDLGLVDELLREPLVASWEAMRPWAIENRKRTKNEAIWRNFEYLYNEVKKTMPDTLTHEEMIRVGHMYIVGTKIGDDLDVDVQPQMELVSR